MGRRRRPSAQVLLRECPLTPGVPVHRNSPRPFLQFPASVCERLNGTLRRDCLDHIIVRDDVHADRVLKEYVRYYHGRPHRGLRMQPPLGTRWLAPVRRVPPKDVVSRPVLGGLHHEYHARVA